MDWVKNMMIKRFLAVTATAITLTGSAFADTVSFTLDAFITSNFNATTLAAGSDFVDPNDAAGTLSFSFDTIDLYPDLLNNTNTAFVFLDGGFNQGPSSFDLTLTLNSIEQTWTQADFVFPFAVVDMDDSSMLEQVGFFLPTSDTTEALADENIISFAPALVDFLRFDAAGIATGVNLEVTMVEPLVFPTAIPLPGSLPLLATGAFAAFAFRRKTRKTSES